MTAPTRTAQTRTAPTRIAPTPTVPGLVAQPVLAQPLTAAAFEPFGDVIDTAGGPTMTINAGRCERFHDLAALAVGDGRAGISLFRSDASALPWSLTLMERHPLGSQAFIPMSAVPFLVVVAPDDGGRPGAPCAFLTAPHQGVNYHANVWHAPLMALQDGALFAVIDRIGPGINLEEAVLPAPVPIDIPEDMAGFTRG